MKIEIVRLLKGEAYDWHSITYASSWPDSWGEEIGSVSSWEEQHVHPGMGAIFAGKLP